MTSLGPVEATLNWVDEWVIALNLCPFALGVRRAGLIRTVALEASSPEAILTDVVAELTRLSTTPRSELATTLLVLPRAFEEFADFLDFMGPVEAALTEMGLDGDIQVATFHPQYRFAEVAADDLGNYTNRSPYPTLHLIREADITDALESHPDPDGIVPANLARLEDMGLAQILARLDLTG